jgi:hypothetical protein
MAKKKSNAQNSKDEQTVEQYIPRAYEIVSPDDPMRPITWRYDRLRYLLNQPPDQQVLLDDVDDLGIRHAYLFLQRWAACHTPEERYLIRHQYPGLTEAVQLYKYQEVQKTGLMEGYILADCNVGSIADKFSLLPDAVNWYEQLFFDVRTRLSNTMFVELSAIQSLYDTRRQAYKRKKVEHHLAAAYKAFGYHGGIVALELISTGFLSSDAKPLHRETAVTFIQNAASLLASNQGTLLLHGRRIFTKPDMAITRMAVNLALKARREGKLEVIQNVSRALESVAPLIGADVKQSIQRMLEHDPEAGNLLQASAELRAEDQLRFDRGMLPQEQIEKTLQITFQPSKNNES